MYNSKHWDKSQWLVYGDAATCAEGQLNFILLLVYQLTLCKDYITNRMFVALELYELCLE
jgi:hypothetical protein